jgi:DNA polymerase III sliding clamp (beta) subunit (PCNA family)
MLTFESATLKKIMRFVKYAASKDRKRAHLAPIRIERTAGEVVAFATDGYRFAVSYIAEKSYGDDFVSAVPAPVLDYMAKTDDEVTFTEMGASTADLEVKNTDEIPQPPWRTILENVEDRDGARFSASRSDMLDFLKENVTKQCTYVTIRSEGSMVVMWAAGKEKTFDSLVASGTLNTVHIDPKYLMEALKASSGAAVTIYGPGGALDPIVFQTVDTLPALKRGYAITKHLIMPRRGE